MTYKIVANPRAWWPVIFAGVTEEGEVVENRFDMRFRLLDQDSAFALEREVAEAMAQDDTAGLRPSRLATDLVLRIAEDWRGVTEDDGSEAGRSLPFSEENVATLMNVANVFAGVLSAFRACRAGEAGARRGN